MSQPCDGGCSWPRVGSSQGYLQTSHKAQDSLPQQRIVGPPNVTNLGVEKPRFKATQISARHDPAVGTNCGGRKAGRAGQPSTGRRAPPATVYSLGLPTNPQPHWAPNAEVPKSNERDADQAPWVRQGVSKLTEWEDARRGGTEALGVPPQRAGCRAQGFPGLGGWMGPAGDLRQG